MNFNSKCSRAHPLPPNDRTRLTRHRNRTINDIVPAIRRIPVGRGTVREQTIQFSTGGAIISGTCYRTKQQQTNYTRACKTCEIDWAGNGRVRARGSRQQIGRDDVVSTSERNDCLPPPTHSLGLSVSRGRLSICTREQNKFR